MTHASGLTPFKEAFCNAGYAVFAFDYRHFGESDGQPRQTLSPRKEVADWLVALNFARQLDRIDGSRICLLGTSFSGGLVIVAAAKDGNVQCTISRCPMTDSLASLPGVVGYAGLMQAMRLTYHGTVDWLRRGLVMSPRYIASAGRPASAAAKAAERMPNAEVKHYPVGHFDVYRGEARAQSIDDQLYFLARFSR